MSYVLSQSSDWSRWSSRPIRSLQYIIIRLSAVETANTNRPILKASPCQFIYVYLSIVHEAKWIEKRIKYD